MELPAASGVSEAEALAAAVFATESGNAFPSLLLVQASAVAHASATVVMLANTD